MSAPVTLARGGEGELVSLEGEVLRAVFTRAFAPGAPAAMELAVDGEALSIEGKTIDSKRREDGRFDVRLRLINLRREARAALERALG